MTEKKEDISGGLYLKHFSQSRRELNPRPPALKPSRKCSDKKIVTGTVESRVPVQNCAVGLANPSPMP